MATTAMGAVTPPTTLLPSQENTFGLSVDNEVKIRVEEPPEEGSIKRSIAVWKNSHLGFGTTPYIPSQEDKAFLSTCRGALNNNRQTSISSVESFFLHHDLSVVVLGLLDVKSVINFSKVNKCMYLAAKEDIVWQDQLLNLLPNVRALPSNLCVFSPQQQFQIINQRINDERKAYQAKFDGSFRIWLAFNAPNTLG